MECCYEATVSTAMHTDRLENQHDELEKENHEKYHEIEARVTSEGFVGWTIPVRKRNISKKIQLFRTIKLHSAIDCEYWLESIKFNHVISQ